jgi:hypothetical protein
MMKPEQIIARFNRDFGRFYETMSEQRAEIAVAYEYRDCNQTKQIQGMNWKANTLITTVNIAAPMVRAVAGSEVMAATTLDFVCIDPNFESDADIASDVVTWSQDKSNYYSQRHIAAEDAATAGIGAIVTYLDTTQKDFIAGVPIVERVFPNFCLWDTSPRGSLLNEKARWCGYADPIDRETLGEYIERVGEFNNKNLPAASDYKDMILSYQTVPNYDDLDFLYNYFWFEFTTIYDVANPFDGELGQLIMQDVAVANAIGEVAKKLNLDWQASYWTLDKDDFVTMKNAVEAVTLLLEGQVEVPPLEYSKRDGKCYYRAQLGGGKLIMASRSFTQNGHPLNFYTGYYEEAMGIYYGMMRPLSYIQDYLNIAMTDLLRYVRSASHGGAAYIQGAGESFLRIAQERANEDDLTPIPKDAIITPKARADAVAALNGFITMMIDIMPRTLGLGQEFFGVISSGDMTDSLFGKVMKQSFAVLENWKNAAGNADIRQGYIFLDLARIMAEANDGMVITAVSGDNKNEIKRLTTQNLARNYAITAVERPLSRDEKQESFNTLSQLAPQFMQAGVNLYPVLARMAPLDKQERDELIKLSTPTPPQSDPAAQAMQKATIDYTSAQAAKSMAEAEKIRAETPIKAEQTAADIDETQAKTAKILSEIAQAEAAQVQQILSTVGQPAMNNFNI